MNIRAVLTSIEMTIIKNLLCVSLLIASCGIGVNAQTVKSKNPHSAAHRELLASRAKGEDQIKLVEKNTYIDLVDEAEPEIDIYTEGWNSKRVNPFNEKDVPNSKVIDVSSGVVPVKGRLTSNYGYRAKFGRMHKGVDLALRVNDTVYAAFEGKVRLTNYEAKGYGNYVILRHPNGLETVYGHLNKFLVKPDQVVKVGQPIALGGNTGRSTGPHLHFETRFMGYAINPSAIFDFDNKTTHTDTYAFSKSTYTQPRNFAPKGNYAKNGNENPYQSAANTATTYTVKKGDTLSSIARSYGMSATTLRRLNNLSVDDKITTGQVLKLK